MNSGTKVPGLASARNRAGLTQVSLAAILGVHPITVTRWESGERTPSIDTVVRLAAALNTTVGALLGEAPAAQGGAA